ncbi:sugar-binding transcriptional regulator [Oceanobacillus locisalsi]|uniref:Sugar-binding transcriptional regulator n=1 Tax=Oceanobacillus locisalsi TaxID=546107 RepID=A0ABW3NG68_9BACI
MSKVDLRLLSKIAYMYYNDNMSQHGIAQEINVSRSKISRLLVEAREQGIVQINVSIPVTRCFDLEQQLEEAFGISEAIVAPVYSTKEENILNSLGQAGADYLLNHVREGMTVGFSMGETLKKLTSYLGDEQQIDCEVVPIMGGNWPKMGYGLDANTISQRVAEKLGAKCFPLYAPAIVSNEDLKESILSDLTVQNVFQKSLETDITFISVGVESSSQAHIHLLTDDEKKQSKEANVIGEVAFWFFDSEGRIPDIDIHNRVIGPSIEQISQHSKIVLLSGNSHKKEAIASALAGGWVDTLITDEHVAAYLLRSLKEDGKQQVEPEIELK